MTLNATQIISNFPERMHDMGLSATCIANTTGQTIVNTALTALCPLQELIGRHVISIENQILSVPIIGVSSSLTAGFMLCDATTGYLIAMITASSYILMNNLSRACQEGDYISPLETLGQLPSCVTGSTIEKSTPAT
jgi:hypothetical protein